MRVLQQSHQALNQPHQQFHPQRLERRVQEEQLERQSLARTLEDGTVVSERSARLKLVENG